MTQVNSSGGVAEVKSLIGVGSKEEGRNELEGS